MSWEDGIGYTEFVQECIRHCSCCPDCWDVPCDGTMAGGICDHMCHCGGELDPLDRMDPDYCSDEEDMP